MDSSLKNGDHISTFCFDETLHTKDLAVPKDQIADVYIFMGKYFDFVRKNVHGTRREYYHNLSKSLQDNETHMPSTMNQEGIPVYLILCIFGAHNPRKLKFTGADSVDPTMRTFKNDLGETSPGRDNIYMTIRTEVDKSMMNLMVVTSCLDTVKKEKIMQTITFAKRSLFVDLKADKTNLPKLLSEFIN